LMTLFYRTHMNIHANLILLEIRVATEDFRRWQYVSIFISFHAIIFQNRTVKSLTKRRESRIEHKISIQGRSRSRILGSPKSWRWTAYRYIIMLASSPKLRKE